MSPDQYCQEKIAKSASSFYYSFLFLEPTRRQAIMALYAYCREVDDVVDECVEPTIARIKLAWWRTELAALYQGRPSHPVSRALATALRHFKLPEERLLEIIDGMEMDLDHNRYADFDALNLYCYRVAGVVGLLAAEIFGYQDKRTLDYALDLGLAFQMTNIIRDVGEDARRGRIYLPEDDLRRFGVPVADILERRASDNFCRLMEFEVERTQAIYARALAHLPRVDRKAQRAGLAMAAIYRALLAKIKRDPQRVLDRRTSLPPLYKLWLATLAWIKPAM